MEYQCFDESEWSRSTVKRKIVIIKENFNFRILLGCAVLSFRGTL